MPRVSKGSNGMPAAGRAIRAGSESSRESWPGSHSQYSLPGSPVLPPRPTTNTVSLPLPAANKAKPKIVQEDDIFATMGFAAQPTLKHGPSTSAPSATRPVTTTSALPSTWRNAAVMTVPALAPPNTTSAAQPRGTTTAGTTKASVVSKQESLDDWDDDGDLDDLLDD
jgi:hypothetical protein